MTKKVLSPGMVGVGVPVFVAVSIAGMSARQVTSEAVNIDNDNLGGVVTSAKGTAAGGGDVRGLD